MRDEVFCRLCLVLQDTLFCDSWRHGFTARTKSRGVREATLNTKKDANCLIVRA